MIGILLLSHGGMAEGMLDSSKLFFGENIEKIKAISLYLIIGLIMLRFYR